MFPILRMLAAIGDALLSTIPPVPAPIPDPLPEPPYGIPAIDWGMAVGAVTNRTGADQAASARALTDALDILSVLADVEDILDAEQLDAAAS